MNKVLKKPGAPEIYINEETGKGFIVLAPRTIRQGCIRIKKDRYKYFQYRLGKKIIQEYLGVLKK